MVGYEAAGTLAGETINAAKSVPLAMIKAVAVSGIGGFFMVIALLFACRDSPDSILLGPTAQPVINIFALAF